MLAEVHAAMFLAPQMPHPLLPLVFQSLMVPDVGVFTIEPWAGEVATQLQGDPDLRKAVKKAKCLIVSALLTQQLYGEVVSVDWLRLRVHAIRVLVANSMLAQAVTVGDLEPRVGK